MRKAMNALQFSLGVTADAVVFTATGIFNIFGFSLGEGAVDDPYGGDQFDIASPLGDGAQDELYDPRRP